MFASDSSIMLHQKQPSECKKSPKEKWLRTLVSELPLFVGGTLLVLILCPGLNFRIGQGKLFLSRSSSASGYGFSLVVGDLNANYESGPELAKDDGMWCGEFPTGTGWTWRKGIAYAGTEVRWFIGCH